MNPQERALIESVFSRLAQLAGAPKDPEAVALINQHLVNLPDASYGLVQAVAVQEMALQQAHAHIADLEHRLSQGAPAPAGGFLGGGAAAWTGGPAPRGPSAIPSVPAGPAYGQAPPQQPSYGAQPQAAPQPHPSPWGAGAGGFLRSAATTAAGVAGGMLVAESISSLFGGHRGGFGGGMGGFGGGMMGGQPETIVNNYYGDDGSGANDPGQQDNSGGYDAGSGGGFGGNDSGTDAGSGDGSGGGDSGSGSSWT